MGKSLRRSLKPVLAVALCAAMLCGCMPDLRLNSGAYVPAPAPGRAPARVALVVPRSLRTLSYEMGLPYWINQRFYIGPAYPKAVWAMLESLYSDVSVVESMDKASDADYVVTISPDFPPNLQLSFYDGRSRALLASYQKEVGGKPLWVDPPGGIVAGTVAIDILGLAIFPIMLIVSLSVAGGENVKRSAEAQNEWFSAGTAAALAEVAREIVKDGRLQTDSARREIAAAERAGDGERGRGDGAAALADYSRALRLTWLAGPDGQRLQGKVFSTAARMASFPPVPPEAQDRMRRAQDLIREAQDATGFIDAAREMSQAVSIAPWWPDGYYNLAMVEKENGDAAGAAFNLQSYLRAAPSVSDAAQVRHMLAELQPAPDPE
jgi:hypothetical protein